MTATIAVAPPPPLAQGLPILGNALDLSNDVMAFVVQQYRKFGPIFRIRALNQEMVVMAGPESNIFITAEGADKFSSYETWAGMGMEFGTDRYMQTAEGEEHAIHRKTARRAYSAGNIYAHMPIMLEVVKKVLDQHPQGSELPTLDFVRLIVTEQLGRIALNHSIGDDLETISKFIGTALKAHVVGNLPKFALRLPAYQRARQRALQLGREVIQQHEATQRVEPDLLDEVMEMRKSYPEVWSSEAQMITAALGPFIAGLDTSSNEITFMLYALLNNPTVLEQCRAEADALFANGMPDQSALRNLHALHYAQMETLRMYTIGPAVTRNAAQDFVFNGYQVKKGQKMLLASASPHFMEEVFPEPHKFDITRYQEPRNEHKKRGAYYPFGIGTHICLGAGAAEAQMLVVTAALLHYVELDSPDKGKTIKIINDPTPTLGKRFRLRIGERRH